VSGFEPSTISMTAWTRHPAPPEASVRPHGPPLFTGAPCAPARVCGPLSPHWVYCGGPPPHGVARPPCRLIFGPSTRAMRFGLTSVGTSQRGSNPQGLHAPVLSVRQDRTPPSSQLNALSQPNKLSEDLSGSPRGRQTTQGANLH